MKINKTHAPNTKNYPPQWHFVDAENQTLGRFATKVATLLIGKNKPYFAPNADFGDKVVVTNASKIYVTGKKETQKKYFRHTGYPGGIRMETFGDLKDRRPTETIRKAVFGMLPDNKLKKKRISRLYIYPEANHPHKAQEEKK